MWAKAFEDLFKNWTFEHAFMSAIMRADVIPSGTRAFERASAVLASRVAVKAKQKGIRLIIMAPPPVGKLPDIIATGLLLADFAHGMGFIAPAGETGSLLSGDLLVVTHAVGETVAKLRSVRIGGQRLENKWSVESYSRYKPIADSGPRVYVTNPGWVIDGLPHGRISGVVIDASHPRSFAKLGNILQKVDGVRAQLIVTLPLLASELADLGYPDRAYAWIWDPVAKNILEERILGKSQNVPGPFQRSIWVCSCPELDEGLNNLHGILALMQKTGRGTPPVVWEAWSIYHRLRQLVVPLAQLEDGNFSTWGSMPFSKRIERLREVTPEEIELGALWPDLMEKLQDSYEAFLSQKESPKFWVLAERAQAHLRADRGPLRIVTPTEREGIILSLNLSFIIDEWQSAQQDERVEVIWAKEEARQICGGNTKSTLLAGSRVGSQRHLDLYPGFDTEVIQYPYEAEIDITNQNRIYDFAEVFQREDNRLALLNALDLPPGDDSIGQKSLRPKVEIIGITEKETDSIKPFLYDPTRMDLDRLAGSGFSQTWDDEAALASPGLAGPEMDRGIFIVVKLDGGRIIKYAPGQLVDIYHQSSQRIQRIRAKELRPGMYLILLVDNIYESLFDRLIEALRAHANHYSLIILALWEKAKNEILKKHSGNRMEIYKELAQRGIGVGYSAVNSLFGAEASGQLRLGFEEECEGSESETIAPQQYEDMRILAQYSELFPNEATIRLTFRAIQEERGRRRKAGHALHDWLRAIASGKGYDQAIASAHEIGSEIAEVLNALDYRRVSDVKVSSSIRSVDK